MPIYNEDPAALCMAVDSVFGLIYPKTKLVLYLSFDSDEQSELFMHLMDHLGEGKTSLQVPYPMRTCLNYQGVKIIVNRFPHGGKRSTQALTFDQIKGSFRGKQSGTFVLFIDSDIILYPDCIVEFVRAMEKQKDVAAMTGFISAISSRSSNFYWYFQDCEYVVGQVFARSLEAALGGVTCLPGALTIVRLTELTKAAETYFSDLSTDDIFDFHRYHLGEDRYLTHLLMEQSNSYAIGFCPSARAKTEAPGTWVSFLKQRRRWLLGAFSNEVYFLSDHRIWLRVPLLLVYKLCDFASRSASFFVYIVMFQMITGTHFTVPLLVLVWAPLALYWAMMLVFAIILRRLKVFMMYPIIILINPFMFFFINIYAIWTWNKRSWGGPRALTILRSKKKNRQTTSTANQTVICATSTEVTNSSAHMNRFLNPLFGDEEQSNYSSTWDSDFDIDSYYSFSDVSSDIELSTMDSFNSFPAIEHFNINK